MKIAGIVEKFITIIPRVVKLDGLVGEPIKGSATIIPEKKYPFKIVDIKAKRGTNINYQLEEKKETDWVQYLLTVENLKKEEGQYYDTIQLITDNEINPVIKIWVQGNILGNKKEDKQ